jgi:uncharacterized membrane protein YadS
MRSASAAPGARRWPPLTELVPWFIVGFLLMALVRSLGSFRTTCCGRCALSPPC